MHVGRLTHLKRLLDDLVAAIRDITAQQRKMEESLHAQTVASARMEGRLSALVDSEARLSRSVDRAIEVRAAAKAEGQAP